METAHNVIPATVIKTWVDDTTSTTRGPTEKFVINTTVKAAEFLVLGFKELQGVVNMKKTMVQGSTKAIAKGIIEGLARLNISLKAGAVVRDLGCDATLGTRRRVTTFRARGVKGTKEAA